MLADIESGEPLANYHQELREFVWSLAVRTRALRQQFGEVVRSLTERIFESAAFPRSEDPLSQKLKSRLTAALEGELGKLPSSEKAMTEDFLSSLGVGKDAKVLADSFLGSPIVRRFSEEFLRAVEPEALDKATARGQIEGLRNLLSKRTPPDSFAPRRWSLHEVSSKLILGDGCVFVIDNAGRALSLMLARSDWDHVYLPMTPVSILVGSRTDFGGILSAGEISSYSAGLSWSHFFSSTMDESVRGRAKDIGGTASELVEEELSFLAAEP